VRQDSIHALQRRLLHAGCRTIIHVATPHTVTSPSMIPAEESNYWRTDTRLHALLI
jgi:hypothetical protein